MGVRVGGSPVRVFFCGVDCALNGGRGCWVLGFMVVFVLGLTFGLSGVVWVLVLLVIDADFWF